MPNQEGQTVALALVKMWIIRFAWLVNFLGDKGTNSMPEGLRELYRILAVERFSARSSYPQGTARIEETNRTLKDGLTMYVEDNQHEWKCCLQIILIDLCSSFHSVTNNSASCIMLRTLLKLPIERMFEKRHIKVPPTPNDFGFKTKGNFKSVYCLNSAEKEQKGSRQKVYHNYRAHGPMYSQGKQVLVFVPTFENNWTRKYSLLFTRDPKQLWKMSRI